MTYSLTHSSHALACTSSEYFIAVLSSINYIRDSRLIHSSQAIAFVYSLRCKALLHWHFASIQSILSSADEAKECSILIFTQFFLPKTLQKQDSNFSSIGLSKYRFLNNFNTLYFLHSFSLHSTLQFFCSFFCTAAHFIKSL